MKSSLIISLLLCFNCLHSQETWITTIESHLFERVFDIREIPNGNHLAVGRRELSPGPECYSFLVEITRDGEIIREQDIIIPDSSNSLHQFIAINDTSFAMIGLIRSDANGQNDLWIVHFNYDLEIISQKKLHSFPTYPFGDFRAKFISNGNLLINGFIVDDNLFNSDIFFYETNVNGDSISSAVIEMESMQLAYEFLERKNGLGYYVYANGVFPVDPQVPGISDEVLFDTNFNYLADDSVPRLITNTMNAKWLSSNSYLISGKEYYHNPLYCNMGILKLNTDDQILNENYFGLMPDTITYTGALDHLDFRNPDTIFFAGVGNIIPEDFPYQTEPSWIIVNCLDSNLNLRWQTLYGGDAFYFSWEVYATSDGGCIVAASRYDYTQPEYDYDVVLLKYDNSGLLTDISENGDQFVSMSVYPNPGTDIIKIENDFEDAVFQLFDESGKMILSSNLDKGLNQIIVGRINSGMYVYMISIHQKPVSSGKWIKR
jgi:hypothetical protein